MATREENLKKINEQPEQLSDEQLEQIAGGNTEETRDLIEAIGYVSEHTHGGTGKKFYTLLDPFEVESYLKKTYGIDAKIYFDREMFGCGMANSRKANEYSRNGKSLTQKQVLDIIHGK